MARPDPRTPLITNTLVAMFAVAAALAATAAVAVVAAGDELDDKVADLARPYVDGGWVRSAVVGIAARGRPARVWGFGHAAADPNSPAPDGRTVYEIASVSKTFTALLLADMVRRGEVGLDDLVAKHLPPDVKVPEADKPMTLLRLATHHSGLPRMPGNFRPADPSNPYADYTVERLYEALAACRPHATEKFEYSNLGFAVLGTALSRRAGTGYEALVKERVCGPLGMGDTAVALGEAMKARLAPPFDADGDAASNWDLPTFAAGGGLRSTCDDMLRYAVAHLDAAAPAPAKAPQADGPAPPGGAARAGPLPATLAAALRDVQAPRDSAGGQTRIALAWHVTRDGRHWHNGQTGGYHSFVAFDTGTGVAVVVLTNTATMRVDALGGQVLRLACGQRAVPPALPQAKRLDPAVLDRYAGRYRLPDDSTLLVVRDGDRLLTSARGRRPVRIYPRTETEFFARAVDSTGTFEVDPAGAVTGLVIRQDGKETRAARK